MVVHEQGDAVTWLKSRRLKLMCQMRTALRPHRVGSYRMWAMKQRGAVGVLTRHAFKQMGQVQRNFSLILSRLERYNV